MRKRSWLFLALAFILLVYSAPLFVVADPSGASLTVGTSSRKAAASPGTVQAQAGNVTQVNIYGESVTQSWAGYYGNVTGKLVLADASNNTFYDWTLANPGGEVYASRASSINWASIQCANAAAISAEETALGQTASDADSVSNTFSSTSHPAFFVGSVSIAANSCPSTNAYNATGAQSNFFYQILLYDGTNIVYTTLIENNANGFDNNTYDFELLVGEDGHGAAASTTTTYYFWVELE